jgi:hypothetical protein
LRNFGALYPSNPIIIVLDIKDLILSVAGSDTASKKSITIFICIFQ